MTAADMTHLIRLSLKRDDAAVAPLLRDLMPAPAEDAMALHHRLLWTLYADRLERRANEAPFLWRRMDEPGGFMVLGPQPALQSPYFKVEAKPFDVHFFEGQRLAFELRLNATADIKAKGGTGARGRRTDIVLAALHRLQQTGDGPTRSGALRLEAAQAAVEHWMNNRAAAAGFLVERLLVSGYRAVPPPMPRKSGRTLVGISDVEGVLRVVDPAAFRTRLLGGFGRMKAYGCGLMLVRPAPG